MIEARNMGMTKEEVLRFIWQAKKVQAFPLALHKPSCSNEQGKHDSTPFRSVLKASGVNQEVRP